MIKNIGFIGLGIMGIAHGRPSSEGGLQGLRL